MKKNYLFILILLTLFVIDVNAQDQCGNHPSEEQIEYLSKTANERQVYQRSHSQNRNGAAFDWVPINLVSFRDGNGTNDGFTEFQISDVMKFLNAAYFDQNIQFFECGPSQIIPSAPLFDFDIATEETLLSAYDVPNVVNIYLFNTLKNGSSSYCGLSYLPPSVDRILLSKDFGCAPWRSVIHEMGHYLSLYHTHGKFSGLTDELVDGSNCTSAGDDICDTPADPNLAGNVNQSTCTYTGTAQDVNLQYFTPDVTNFMSYAWPTCRSSFSQGQESRMAYSLANDRNYLTACSHPAACETPITSFPANFDFETGMEGWWNGSYVDYPNIGYSQYSGPTTNPGPSSAQSGTKYISLNSAANSGDVRLSVLRSPCFDLSSMNNPHISFKFYQTGSVYNGFGVQVGTDAGYNWAENALLELFSGDYGASWQSHDIDLTPYKAEEIIQLRFLGIYEMFELSDISFDNIIVYDANPSCSLSGTSSSSDALCFGSASGMAATSINGAFTPPLAYVWNNGSTNSSITNLIAGAYDVTVTDNQGCVYQGQSIVSEPSALASGSVTVTDAINGSSNGSIVYNAIGGTLPYSYLWSNGAVTSTISGLAPNTYSVDVTDANGCTHSEAYTITNTIVCNPIFNTFPYNNSFENSLGIFTQESADDFDWTKWSGSTPTNKTGPNSAKNGTYYYYTEANGNIPYKSAILKTSYCLDLSGVSDPIFKIFYHMKGKHMGTFKIEVSTDNEQTWTSVFSKSGKQGNNWKKATIDLMPYQNTPIKIRLVGTTKTGKKSDMAIDKCFIGSNPTPDVIQEMAEKTFDYSIYPNPTSHNIQMRFENGVNVSSITSIEIYDHIGRVVQKIGVTDVYSPISIEALDNGYYFIRIQTNLNKSITKKFIVVR